MPCERKPMKAKWRELKYDLTAYVDEQGEIIAKIYQNYDQTWRYKEKEFIDRWSAMQYVEKVKKYDNSGMGWTDDGGGHAGNGHMGPEDGNGSKNNKKRGRKLPDRSVGGFRTGDEMGDESEGDEG